MLLALSSGVFIASTGPLVALWVASMTIFGLVTAVLCWRNHKLKQNGACSQHRVITAVSLLSLSVSHQRSPSLPLPPPGTPSGDPTPTGDPNSIQLQPNPSYCLLEMSNQQLMSSQLENEAKYVNL